MRLKSIELSGFKSFAKKTPLQFGSAITAIVGPNGSGKSNIAEAFRFCLGEQSMKSMRGRRGEDLIWNGSAHSPRAGRASAKLVFDNSDRALNLDFDEVTIERVVNRDGNNEYSLNGSQVRLRDIAELLSHANIGASGHHIISQGEADRILSSSARERRDMVEDALGLTGFLYKREEAERKLQKTAENVREVEVLRREVAPHLKFLQSQVKKVEEGQKLRNDLSVLYAEYLKREILYLETAEAAVRDELDAPSWERAQIDAAIAHLKLELGTSGAGDKETRELMRLEEEGRTAAHARERATRELGRIEGEVAASERLGRAHEEHLPAREAREFAEHILTLGSITEIVAAAKNFLRRLAERAAPRGSGTAALAVKKTALEHELRELQTKEEHMRSAVAILRKKIESDKDQSREAERELFQRMARRSELDATLAGLHAQEDILKRERESFKAELAEAAALIGREVLAYEKYQLSGDEERGVQDARRKKIERLKIRLEESGAGDASVMLKEFTETSERDQFLARELGDLAASEEKLDGLIAELTKTLETRKALGIEKINKEFDEFFKLMFGGGSASLHIIKEKKFRRLGKGLTLESDELRSDLEEGDEDETETEEGIEVSVSLPHKRIKGLHALSGGERALTSIALIFAMSQVNPPPFLILDETDAALDEANSRRYGDMIENLARKSQLILITHNRETMSRAGILYGVTMGEDGISKLLSVKFEEALAVYTSSKSN